MISKTVGRHQVRHSRTCSESKSETEHEYMNHQSWRPYTLRTPTLSLLVFITCGILAVIISLHYIDSRNGALILAGAGARFSITDILEVRYLPTIIVVLYAMIISTIDLDIRRLDPWFRLSRKTQYEQRSPLTCRYDTDFVGTVLVQAVRDRHWTVVASAILMIATSLIVPALQSSMLVIQPQRLEYESWITEPSQLVNLTMQNLQVTSTFLQTAYAMTWLGLSPPRFTTRQYALAPFGIFHSKQGPDLEDLFVDAHLGRNISLDETLISSETTRYWTELECWSPASIALNFSTNSASFDDGKGCYAADMTSFNSSITEQYPQELKYEAYVFGIGSFGYLPFFQELQMQCPERPHLFLMTYRKSGPATPDFSEGGNATAMFCEPTYYVEPVHATVRAVDFQVESFATLGPRRVLTHPEFNTSMFETLITRAAPEHRVVFNNNTALVDISDVSGIGHGVHLANMSVVTPIQASGDVTIGFALGATKLPSEDYLDFQTLSKAYNDAHQLLFAQAVAKSFQQRSDIFSTIPLSEIPTSEPTHQAQWTTIEEVAHVVPGFAIGTEILFTCLILLCLSLIFHLRRRVLNLNRNPDCFAEIMHLVRNSGTQEVFSGLSSASEELINHHIDKTSFHLDTQHGLVPYQDDRHLSIVKSVSDVKSAPSKEHSTQLLELSQATSGVVLVLLVGGLGTFFVLNLLISRNNGLGLPSGSGFVQQLILNFIPTLAATGLGLYLALVCRVYSFIKPMQDLADGRATAKGTLLVKYTSLPPSLLSLEALRAKHFVLAILSIAALLANVSTVTIASIFVTKATDTAGLVTLRSLYNPNVVYTSQFDRANSQDGSSGGASPETLYLNSANLTDGTSLPSWTTPDFAFLPMDLPSNQTSSRYTFEATGYGTALSCADFFQPEEGTTTSFELLNNGTRFRLRVNITLSEGLYAPCGFDQDYEVKVGNQDLGRLSNSDSALEISTHMQFYNESGQFLDSFCAQHIVKGWIRARLKAPDNVQSTPQVEYNATMAVCKAQVQTQRFQVVATPQGDIISKTALSPPNTSPSPSVNMSAILDISVSLSSGDLNIPSWHNASDVVARDQPNLFYSKLLGHRNWLNASFPPPPLTEVVPIMSKFLSRTFAVQLFLDRDKLVKINDTTIANKTSSLNARANPNDNETINPLTIQAQATIPQRKIFMSQTNFIITVSILTFDLLVLIIFRFSLPKPFLPRMPFTIASQIAFFANSHVVDDVVNSDGKDVKDYRYGYGRFVGKDGSVCVGIEREPFVYIDRGGEVKGCYGKGSGGESDKVAGWWAGLVWKLGGKQQSGFVPVGRK